MEIDLRGRHRRMDREGSSDDPDYMGGRIAESSHWSDWCRSRDRSNETKGHRHDTPNRDRRRHPNAVLDTMNRVFQRAAQSPFYVKIKYTKMLRCFNRPPFTCYNGKPNPVEHVSHYIQMMSQYSQNNRLMCQVFPSSLRPTTMRWFSGLRKGSIHSFEEFIQAFRE